MQNTFIYDGSFNGLLTAIFEIYELKIKNVRIVAKHYYEASFFEEYHEVITNEEKANRVWKAVIKYGKPIDAHLIYRCFLSEINGIEQNLFNYIKILISKKQSIAKDYGQADVFHLAEVNKKIGREKHRMDAFVRFRKTKDNIYFASISPDFNVLPLLEKHFQKRYADQLWCIYDICRNYGLYYDLNSVKIVHFDLPENILNTSDEIFQKEEIQYQKLWKNYFESTNIKARANQKLHEQHVPRRYWKYLSEKNLLNW
ncbi:probable DNA metabolism protein [Psychroflexus halocasei]|uniref:Probable DNA metabolism protein n=2 Tax=Psychroflexus halocasei TaxID=908615 RepID=A0A1H3WNQ2_9FLAO|nr:probable DNA metabolism protein [Psychroflexus halocasei]